MRQSAEKLTAGDYLATIQRKLSMVGRRYGTGSGFEAVVAAM